MAKSKVAKEAVLTTEVVEKSKAEGEKTVELVEEHTPFHIFKTTPAEVHLRKGLTINKGNFESIRVEVGVVMPCYSEQLEDTFTAAHVWTDKKLEEYAAKYGKAGSAVQVQVGKVSGKSDLPF